MKMSANLAVALTLLLAGSLWCQVTPAPVPPGGGDAIDEDFEGVTTNFSAIHATTGLHVPSGGWTTVDPFLPARPGAAAASRAWAVTNSPTPLGPDPAPAVNETHWMEFGWYPAVANYSVAAVTPSLNLSGASCFVLSFTLHNDGWQQYPWCDDRFEVWYIDNNALTPQWTRAMTRLQQGGDPGQSVTTQENVVIPLASTNVQIAFVVQGPQTNDFDTFMVDNIVLRALSGPEINVARDGQPVELGVSDTLRVTSPWAAPTPQTFHWLVQNCGGTAHLQLSNLSVSNASNCAAQVLTAPASLAPAATLQLGVSITPQNYGQFSFRVHIDSNDADEGAYWFDVVGHAALPGGTYAVGATGHFQDVGEAFEALEDCGVLAAVTFEVASGQYMTDSRYMLGLDGEWLATVMGVSAQNRITFKAAPGASPRIHGSFYSNYGYLGGSKCTVAIACPFVTLEGLEITGGSEAGIHVGSMLVPITPPILVPANDVTIRGCKIHSVTNGMAILATAAWTMLDNLVIENCAIYDCKTCYFPNFTSWYSQGMITIYNAGMGCRVNHNTLIQNTGALYYPSGFSHNNHLAVVGALGGPLAEFSNNIVVSTINSGTILAFDSGCTPALADNNLYYQTVPSLAFNIDPQIPTYAAWQAAGCDAHGLIGNPGLVSLAAAADIHLTAGSIARDQGGASALTTDFDGDPRPMGTGADIGADEYREPEIDLRLASVSLTSGTGVSLGNVPDSGQDITFEIANTGMAPLTLNGVSVVATSAGLSLQITTPPAASVQPGASTTFVARIVPAIGAFSFALDVTSDDADENPFHIVGDGTGVAAIPQMSVTEGGIAVTARAFGSQDVNAGPTAWAVITISNSGYADLVLGTPALAGADFILDTSTLAPSVAPGASTTFSVAFDPASKGPKSATVSFTHNDPAQSAPFTLSLSGVGLDPAGVTITTANLPHGRVTEPYFGAQLAAANGTAPYSWSLVSGSLPLGLTLSTTGNISGTVAGNDGSFTFTVRVTDAMGGTEDKNLSITVTPGPGMIGGGMGGGGSAGGCTAGGESAAALLLLLALVLCWRRKAAA